MKTLKLLAASAVVVAVAASCLNTKDPYQTGFAFRKPLSAVTNVYANTTLDSIAMFSYGSWAVSAIGSTDWCQMGTTSGKGYTTYVFPVHIEQNTTGKSRSAQFRFFDVNHSDEGYAGLLYYQFATRGDGSLGSAADVESIRGSDGSLFNFSYDDLHRPTSLTISKNGTSLRTMQLSYNDYDSTLVVVDNGRTLTSHYASDYQPQLLIGSGDTVGYYAQYYNVVIAMPATQAFNLEHHTPDGISRAYAYLLGGQYLDPDSLHCADSLRISGATRESLKLTYSKADNRRQSVDVNQLIFGAEQCDPYQLLSLFRYTRSTSIISRADGAAATDRIDVSTTLNTQSAVNTMTVARRGEEVTYTFEY